MSLLPNKELSAEVWKLAGPVVVGMVSQTLLNVVDTAMVGRLGAASLGAAGLGGVLAWTVLGAFGALNIGAQAVSARRYGEGNHKEAGQVLDNSLALALMIGCFITIVIAPVMKTAFQLFSGDPAVVSQGEGYIYYRLLGGLPLMVIMAHRGFFNGIGQTKLHMRVAILINTTNVLLNWILIFGNLGAPRLETAGAGLGSALATVVGSVYFLLMGLQPHRRRRFKTYRLSNLNRDVAAGVIRLALPSGLHAFLVMIGFTLFTVIVARIGTVELAATNICITVMSFSFLPGAGMGIAAASLIGQKLGEGDPKGAEIYGWEATKLGMIIMGIIGIIIFIFSRQIILIFTNDPAVLKTGYIPLMMMGAVQVFDAAGMVLSQALEGAGMNRWVLFAEVIVSWGLFLPGTLLFAFVFNWGMIGAWVAFAMYLVIFGVIVTIKFAGGSWKEVRV